VHARFAKSIIRINAAALARCRHAPNPRRSACATCCAVLCFSATDQTRPPQETDDAEVDIVREERIDCVCGVDGEENYDGLWVQCDSCDAWLHGRCVSIRRTPKGAHRPSVCNAKMTVSVAFCYESFPIAIVCSAGRLKCHDCEPPCKPEVAMRSTSKSANDRPVRVRPMHTVEGVGGSRNAMRCNIDCVSDAHPGAVAAGDPEAHPRRCDDACSP